jgi:hypothetical protein
MHERYDQRMPKVGIVPLGRGVHQWEDNIEMDLKELR